MHILEISVAADRFHRQLSLRGSNEYFGNPQNGNFFGCLEFIAEYDSFLATHIDKYGGGGRGIASYLSSKTCDEFIQLMADKV